MQTKRQGPDAAAASGLEQRPDGLVRITHLELWKRLSAVGNDPYLYSSMRTRPGPGRSMALADGAYSPGRRAMV